MKIIHKVLFKPWSIVVNYRFKQIAKLLPDSLYLKCAYRTYTGKKLNLNNPQTFNEKLQWLKIHDRKPFYSVMVDKHSAKKYIAERIGYKYIIPSLGIWNSFDEIDFSKLPDRFVLKTTHDSGGVVVCSDKNSLDLNSAKNKIECSLKNNYFYFGREWPYKTVTPQIIAEEYLDDGNGELTDYKVHCFNGVPHMILVCKNRFKSGGLTEDFFSIEWEHLNVKRPTHKNAEFPIERPKCLEQMIEISTRLSQNIKFLRVDFYFVNGSLYVGELTFFPASGFQNFVPEDYDQILGSYLDLRE